VEDVRSYYLQHSNLNESQEKERNLELLEAASQGDELKVKELISINANVLAMDSKGVTAGDLAAARGHMEILQLLVKAGANVNANRAAPWLQQALRCGNLITAELLIQSGTDVNAKDPTGITAGDLAIARGHVDILQLLVKKLSNFNANAVDRWLHQVLGRGDLATAELLLKLGADINLQTTANQTAPEEALLSGSQDAILLLHQYDCDFHLGQETIRRANPPCLATVLELGAKIGDYPDAGGRHTAASGIVQLCFYTTEGWESIARLLISAGAEFQTGVSLRELQLPPSFPKSQLPKVEFSLEHGADIQQLHRTQEVLYTTLISIINYGAGENMEQQLKRTTVIKGRHLWENHCSA
jgi:hypothetical protein